MERNKTMQRGQKIPGRVRRGGCLLASILLACSSGVQVEGEPKSPTGTQSEKEPESPMTALRASSSGEFFDLADVPESHPHRAEIGFLLWSGVPLEDEEGRFYPDREIALGDYLLWAYAAANRPLVSLGAEGGDLAAAALESAKQEKIPLVERGAGASLTRAEAARIAEAFWGKAPVLAKSEGAEEKALTRAEGVNVLVAAARPEVLEGKFDPMRAEAALLLPTGRFWGAVWDLKLAREGAKERPARAASGKHRGVTIASLKPPERGYGEPSFVESVRYTKSLGADAVALIPYARMLRYDLPTLLYGAGAGYPKGALRKAIGAAKGEGMRVLVKPHLWLAGRAENEGQWTGSTNFSEEGWQDWLARYRAMVLEYAEIAEGAGAEIFVIGTELKSATWAHSEFFRKLIGEVRQIFGGEITYAANHDEFQRISFWGDLDYIGIDAYFELTRERLPTVEKIRAGWAGPKGEIRRAVEAYGKRVLFLEAGYKARPFTTRAPWEWRSEEAEDEGAQETAYRALFESFWGEEWFAGVYIWKYFSDLESTGGEVLAEQFLPYRKRAEGVLREFFSKKISP